MRNLFCCLAVSVFFWSSDGLAQVGGAGGAKPVPVAHAKDSASRHASWIQASCDYVTSLMQAARRMAVAATSDTASHEES